MAIQLNVALLWMSVTVDHIHGDDSILDSLIRFLLERSGLEKVGLDNGDRVQKILKHARVDQ